MCQPLTSFSTLLQCFVLAFLGLPKTTPYLLHIIFGHPYYSSLSIVILVLCSSLWVCDHRTYPDNIQWLVQSQARLSDSELASWKNYKPPWWCLPRRCWSYDALLHMHSDQQRKKDTTHRHICKETLSSPLSAVSPPTPVIQCSSYCHLFLLPKTCPRWSDPSRSRKLRDVVSLHNTEALAKLRGSR